MQALVVEPGDVFDDGQLPNGSWAEIEYEAPYGRVKAVKVSIEGGTAKTTHFEYTDSPSRSTRVVPEGPATVYDMAADGSFVRWQNAGKAPEIEDLGGNLVDPEHRETPKPMEPGVYGLEIKAFSAEGIAKIEVIANGNLQVDEKTCTEDFEKEGVECEHVKDQWVTESANWAPGILYLEVIVTDREKGKEVSEGHEASERFWVNIPYTPPPDPEAEAVPTYSESKTFREEFGLDLDLKGNEEAINERIFGLIRDWNNPNMPSGEVARATSERWGVPLRQVDAAELEFRLAYLDHDSAAINKWGEENFPGTYAGNFIDHKAGGVLYVGFINNQSQRLAELTNGVSLLIPHGRLDTFAKVPTASRASLIQVKEALFDAVVKNEEFGSHVTELELDEQANSVKVGATSPALVETLIGQIVGSSAPVTVYLQPDLPERRSGRNRASGRMMAGDRIFSDQITVYRECTAGFGAWEDRGTKKPNGEDLRARFVLTAGHCGVLGTEWERSSGPGLSNGTEVGTLNRSANESGAWRTDVGAIRVKGGLAPNTVFRNGFPPLSIGAPMAAAVNNVLCTSGMATNEKVCGKVIGKAFIYGKEGSREDIYIMKGRSIYGDSGAPVWNPNQERAVGILIGGPKDNPNLSYVAPLLNIPEATLAESPGALQAPGMFHLNLILGH